MPLTPQDQAAIQACLKASEPCLLHEGTELTPLAPLDLLIAGHKEAAPLAATRIEGSERGRIRLLAPPQHGPISRDCSHLYPLSSDRLGRISGDCTTMATNRAFLLDDPLLPTGYRP